MYIIIHNIFNLNCMFNLYESDGNISNLNEGNFRAILKYKA